MQTDFNRLARALVKHKIHFTTTGAEPRFEMEGSHFTTQELLNLSRENKLTNAGLSEIVTTKRMSSAPSST
jgi:hypothetical protein